MLRLRMKSNKLFFAEISASYEIYEQREASNVKDLVLLTLFDGLYTDSLHMAVNNYCQKFIF